MEKSLLSVATSWGLPQLTAGPQQWGVATTLKEAMGHQAASRPCLGGGGGNGLHATGEKKANKPIKTNKRAKNNPQFNNKTEWNEVFMQGFNKVHLCGR